MAERRSLWAEHPDYRVDLEANPKHVRVTVGGELVAESGRTLLVREASYAPVVYFPRDDVRMQWVEGSEHSTFCPFKGTASHFTLRIGARAAEDAIWSSLCSSACSVRSSIRRLVSRAIAACPS